MKNVSGMVGIVLASAGLFVLGCGSSVQSGSSDNGTSSGSSSVSSSSSSSSSSGTAGSGGAGGAGGGAGGQGGGMAGSGGAGASGGAGGAGGGSSAYATCDECTSKQGASQNECLAEYMACMEWKTCVSIMNCNEFGVSGGPGPCDKTTVKGACCSIQCEQQLPDAEGMARYRALDTCIHCQTCGTLCNTTATYCSVFEPNGEMLCMP